MAIDCTVRADDGFLVAELVGTLDGAAEPYVLAQLLECLAEQPRALLVDLSGMRVAQTVTMSVFSTVARQATRWPGTPVLFCATPPQMHTAAAGLYRRSLVFPTLDDARAHLDTAPCAPPAVTEDLLPVRGAARHGRDVVTDTCLRWNLRHLVAPASLITSELVANVCDHAATMMTLKVTRSARYLLVSVHDGSGEPPVYGASSGRPRGHGLQIVDATAYRWGWMPARDGKVVWASLRVDEP